MIYLELIIAQNCSACKRAESELFEFSKGKDYINFQSAPQGNTELQTTIVPSLFIDGKLFAYGQIDFEKMNSKINKLRNINVST